MAEVVVEEVICNRREKGGKGEETVRRQMTLRTLRLPIRDLVGDCLVLGHLKLHVVPWWLRAAAVTKLK